MWTWLTSHPEAVAVALGVIFNLLARFTTSESWPTFAVKYPRIAGLFLIVKAIFPDLAGAYRGASQAATGDPKKPPTVIISALVLMLSGCSATLAKAGFASPVSPDRCATLSDRASTWGATSMALGAVAGAGGLSMIPVTGRDAQIGLAVGIATASALAVAAGRLSADAAAGFVSGGCAK